MENDPFQQVTAIGAIRPDESQLFASSRQALEQLPSSCCIRHARGGHDENQKETHGIDQDMAFAAFDMLARIIAAYSRPLRCFDALAVHCSCCGMFVTTGLVANLSTKRVMNTLPCAIITKLLKVGIHTLP